MAVCALASPIFAHDGEDDKLRSAAALDPDSQAVVAVARLSERVTKPNMPNLVKVATPQLVVRDSVMTRT